MGQKKATGGRLSRIQLSAASPAISQRFKARNTGPTFRALESRLETVDPHRLSCLARSHAGSTGPHPFRLLSRRHRATHRPRKKPPQQACFATWPNLIGHNQAMGIGCSSLVNSPLYDGRPCETIGYRRWRWRFRIQVDLLHSCNMPKNIDTKGFAAANLPSIIVHVP